MVALLYYIRAANQFALNLDYTGLIYSNKGSDVLSSLDGWFDYLQAVGLSSAKFQHRPEGS